MAIGGALVVLATLAYAATAVFPGALYTYTEQPGLVTKAQFSQVAEEVEAIQAALGVNLQNVKALNGTCVTIPSAANKAGVEHEIFINFSATQVVALRAACHCDGDCTTLALFQVRDRGGNQIAMTSPLVCSTGTALSTTVLVDPSDSDRVLVPGEGLRFFISNTPAPAADEYTLCVGF